jgi:virulence-associated protein VagC
MYIHRIHMGPVTARVFKSGNSQAIRLPKALRLRTKTVQIEKTGRGLLILDPKAEAQRVRALSKLYGSCPDFPDLEPLDLPES